MDGRAVHCLIGVDTGGTFTDVVAWDGRGFRTAKVPSTPPDFQRGVVEGIEAVLGNGETAEVVHGSTVATNALLERKGEAFAFITTEGFGDLLLIGRQNRPELYALEPRRKLPLVRDGDIFTLHERMDGKGQVLEALDGAQVERVIEQIRARGLRHAAVCLLFSFVNPLHERMVGERLAQAGIAVTLSSELLPEFREYERASVTAINAALRPNVEMYLRELVAAMPGGVRSLRVMHSGGGTLEPADAGRFAARLLLSGPAGGVLGATHIAGLEGFGRVITYDMGGTSTDVAASMDGKPPWTTGTTVAGLPVPLAMFDIHTIGAGGGSIAALDLGGALQVGPRSAGAAPGPACYGRGGTLPTVTDANLVLGRLVADRFLGGRMRLHRERAEAALAGLAGQMGKSVVETALGILRVAESNMAAAIRHVTAGRGHDPRGFTLVSFGGAGGLHAAALAEALEIPRVLIPANAGLLSALGMVVAPPLVDVSRTIAQLDAVLDDRRLGEEYERLIGRSAGLLAAEKTAAIEMFADCRFQGQSYELTVAVVVVTRAAIEQSFREAYLAMYGHSPDVPSRRIEIVTLRVRRMGRAPAIELPRVVGRRSAERLVQVTLSGGEVAEVPVLDRAGVVALGEVAGPALLAEADSTTLIPSGWIGRATEIGGVVMEGA